MSLKIGQAVASWKGEPLMPVKFVETVLGFD